MFLVLVSSPAKSIVENHISFISNLRHLLKGRFWTPRFFDDYTLYSSVKIQLVVKAFVKSHSEDLNTRSHNKPHYPPSPPVMKSFSFSLFPNTHLWLLLRVIWQHSLLEVDLGFCWMRGLLKLDLEVDLSFPQLVKFLSLSAAIISP